MTASVGLFAQAERLLMQGLLVAALALLLSAFGF